MSSVNLSQILGGSAYSSNVKAERGSLASGVTGTILTITAAAGNKVRLDSLYTTSGTEANIWIGVDGVNINRDTLASYDGPNGFIVSQNQGEITSSGLYRSVISDVVGTEITILKTNGNTANTIQYSYSEGK